MIEISQTNFNIIQKYEYLYAAYTMLVLLLLTHGLFRLCNVFWGILMAES